MSMQDVLPIQSAPQMTSFVDSARNCPSVSGVVGVSKFCLGSAMQLPDSFFQVNNACIRFLETEYDSRIVVNYTHFVTSIFTQPPDLDSTIAFANSDNRTVTSTSDKVNKKMNKLKRKKGLGMFSLATMAERLETIKDIYQLVEERNAQFTLAESLMKFQVNFSLVMHTNKDHLITKLEMDFTRRYADSQSVVPV